MSPVDDRDPINGQMTVLDIVRAHSETKAVFQQLDKQINCCVMCDHLFDSLESLANRYELDLDDLIQTLKQHMLND